MVMTDADHPIWNILRLLVMMVALTVILYLTASRFDQTEIRTICLAFIAGGLGIGVEGVIRALKSTGA